MNSEISLPSTKHVLLDIPEPHVLLVTINNPARMNALSIEACWEMDKVWTFLDDEARLRVGILTGAGDKAFSAGMDLKNALELRVPGTDAAKLRQSHRYPPSGFGGLTTRGGKKPVIAAVNGHANGGGFELVLNSDIVVAASHASFRLPDVMRGTAALQGAFPRLVRAVGMQRAALIALTAYELSAQEAHQWGIVARVVSRDENDGTGIVQAAVDLAKQIASMSPDSVLVSRLGLRQAWETASVDRAADITHREWGEKLMNGANAKEGMTAFFEKRKPAWRNSSL